MAWVPVLFWFSRTAQASVAEAAVTAVRSLVGGLGTCFHVVPFQCTSRVYVPPRLLLYSPAAQARLDETTATPFSVLAEPGCGGFRTVQPTQAEAGAVPGPRPISAVAVTNGTVSSRTLRRAGHRTCMAYPLWPAMSGVSAPDRPGSIAFRDCFSIVALAGARLRG